MSLLRTLFIAVSCMLFTAVVNADRGIPTPETLTGGNIITPAEVKTLIETADVTVIDVRNPINYGRNHVPSAIIVPYSGKSKKVVDFDASLDKFNLAKLPTDKDAKIVIYSHGITGWKSFKAATYAIQSGYTNIHWMREGLGTWIELGYPTE